MQVTGVRQQQAWHDRVLPPVEQVRSGLWSIPVPIDDSPLRYVLSYAFALPDGVAVLDPGWPSDQAWQALLAGLDVAGYRPVDVRAILVTHMHTDHFGLVPRLRAASGAWVGMHAADAALVAAQTQQQADAQTQTSRRQLIGAGAPESVAASPPALTHFAASSGPDVLIGDGDRVDLPGWDLRAIHTPGHTPGHLCFLEGKHGVLLTGDHVLPRISPNISQVPGQLPRPLGTYFESLRSISEVDAGEILPAHEYRFRGLAERVGGLLSHHHDRLAEIEKALADEPGSTCWALTARLTWSRPFATFADFPARLAVRETLAHLVLLAEDGRARCSDEEIAHWYPSSRKATELAGQ